MDEQLQAQLAAMREALELSTSALEYVAGELRELGEDGDADMMERQAKENHVALATDAGREFLERLREAERGREMAWQTARSINKIMAMAMGVPLPETE